MSANRRAHVQSHGDPENSGQPSLVYNDRSGAQQVFEFAPGAQAISVGRRRSSDLVLDWDDQVSRLHARFERHSDGWELVDDGLSSNGTFVNDERLTGRRRLSDGDLLRFGATTATFRSPMPLPAEAPPAPGVTLSTTQRRVLAALCRPYKGNNRFASPATDEQIADELILSVSEVKRHLSVLCAKLGIDRPAEGGRVRLVELAFSTGLISERDL